MLTALFVHGTGTRDPAYSQTLADVRDALNGLASVGRCYWGETEGARLRAGGASIPQYATARAIVETLPETPTEEDEAYQIALWDLLLRDPLIELRLLATSAGPPKELSFADAVDTLEPTHITDWDRRVPADDPLRAHIAASRLAPLLEEVCEAVAVSPALSEAQAVVEKGDETTLQTVAARAVLAAALGVAAEQDIPSPARYDAALRDALVDGFAALLTESSRGRLTDGVRNFVRAHVTKPLAGLAAGFVTDRIRRRRGTLSDAVTGPSGDILLYQGRGSDIRGFIQHRVAECDGPVALIAHSLGGIACVDLLALAPLPQVKLLVTCGSQAPLFYEINALQSLPFRDVPTAQRLPKHFPPWLNFYDLRDFLSYVAEPLFANEQVRDVPVDNRLPFPESHSGYWRNPNVWREVRAALARL